MAWGLVSKVEFLSLSSPELRVCLAFSHHPHPAHHTTAAAMLKAAVAPPSFKDEAEASDNHLPLPFTHAP